jgi:hypothetical protein
MNKCQNCGKKYQASRSSSKFCSDVCRVKANRKAKRAVRIDLDKDKVDTMVKLLKSKIDALSDDIVLAREMIRDAKDEQSKTVWQHLLIRYDYTKNELQSLWDCLGLSGKCRKCGQKVMFLPKSSDECQFCGNSDWKIGG